nr:ORF4 [Torque teno virus]
MSFWRPPVHNATGIQRLWYESFHRGHAAFCGCGDPILHITALAETYGHPTGPRPSGPPRVDPDPQIRRARPAPAAPEPSQVEPRPALPWHGDGGSDGGAGGSGSGGPVADFADDGLDQLVAALDDEEKRLRFTPKRIETVEQLGDRGRDRSPLGRRAGEPRRTSTPVAAPTAAPRTAKTQTGNPVPLRATDNNPTGGSQKPIARVGPEQWLFPERKPKPPPTAQDWAEEYTACKYWGRPPRKFLTDTPFYTHCKTNYNVTFMLNYQ